jgi:hypothetical protein
MNFVENDFTFTIDASDDTVKTYGLMYKDLSAWPFRVNLDYPSIDEHSNISFSLLGTEDAETEISVFKYNGTGDMELIDHSTTRVDVPRIGELTDSGHDLLGLVTNRHATHPYNGTTPVHLKIRVFQELDISGCYIAARDIDADFLVEYSGGSTEQHSGTHGAGFPKETGAEVTFSGSTLTQTHDHLGADGRYYTGSITVTFDAAFENVVSFSAQATISKDDWIMQSSLSGQNIPLDPGESYIIFRATGQETCNRITAMTWSNSYSTYTESLLPGWTCNTESELEIWIFTN